MTWKQRITSITVMITALLDIYLGDCSRFETAASIPTPLPPHIRPQEYTHQTHTAEHYTSLQLSLPPKHYVLQTTAQDRMGLRWL